MTNEEKQIEEMRKDVASIHRFFFEDDDYEILDDYIADMLFEKGYRKASEVAREIFEEIEENMTDIRMEFATLRAIGKRQLAKIKKKYESEGGE